MRRLLKLGDPWCSCARRNYNRASGAANPLQMPAAAPWAHSLHLATSTITGCSSTGPEIWIHSQPEMLKYGTERVFFLIFFLTQENKQMNFSCYLALMTQYLIAYLIGGFWRCPALTVPRISIPSLGRLPLGSGSSRNHGTIQQQPSPFCSSDAATPNPQPASTQPLQPLCHRAWKLKAEPEAVALFMAGCTRVINVCSESISAALLLVCSSPAF